jgi:hypothetical protein
MLKRNSLKSSSKPRSGDRSSPTGLHPAKAIKGLFHSSSPTELHFDKPQLNGRQLSDEINSDGTTSTESTAPQSMQSSPTRVLGAQPSAAESFGRPPHPQPDLLSTNVRKGLSRAYFLSHENSARLG